jgi:hypothetical protein
MHEIDVAVDESLVLICHVSFAEDAGEIDIAISL